MLVSTIRPSTDGTSACESGRSRYDKHGQADDTNRWLLGFHGADLYARGLVRSRRVVSNQKVSWSARAGCDQECSEHRSYDNRLRFPARCHGKAKLTEETFDTVDGTGNGCRPPFSMRRPGRETSIVSAPDAHSVQRFPVPLYAHSAPLNLLFRFVDNRTSCRTLFWRSSRRVVI